MKRYILFFSTLAYSCILAYADYSDRGRFSDLDDNYDSSRGLGFLLFVLAVGAIIVVGAIAKGVWNNHKDSIKEGLGTIAFFAGCILLFLAGKTCSEHRPKDNGHAQPIQHQSSPSPQYGPTHPSNQYTQPQRNNNVYQQPQQPRYRTEYYDERCSQCYGSGSVVCTYCGGKGYIQQICSYCQGEGSKQVYKVVRATIDPSTWEEVDKVYGYESELCTACMGSGRKEVRCTHCNSEYPYGNHLISTYMTCPSCRGQGIFHKSRQVPY